MKYMRTKILHVPQRIRVCFSNNGRHIFSKYSARDKCVYDIRHGLVRRITKDVHEVIQSSREKRCEKFGAYKCYISTRDGKTISYVFRAHDNTFFVNNRFSPEIQKKKSAKVRSTRCKRKLPTRPTVPMLKTKIYVHTDRHAT